VANFEEVNGFAEVKAIRDVLAERAESEARITQGEKKEAVKLVSDRLNLALQNKEIKRVRINLLKARI